MQFRELDVGAGSLWVLGDALDRRMWRLDRRSGRIQATIELGFAPTSVEVANGIVWITDGVRDRLVPLDPADNEVLAGVRVGRGPSGVAAGAGARVGGEHPGRLAVACRSPNATSRGDGRCGWRPPRRGGGRGIGVGDRA